MHRIVLSLFLFLTIGNPLFAQKKLSLADFNQNYTFQEKTVQGLHSSANGLYYTTLEDEKRIVKYSYKDGKKVETVFDLDQLENAAISHFSAYSFSDDETKILLTTEREQIYRHTFSANYYVWNSVTEELAPLSEKGKQQEATFSPNGERVAFVRDNNIFIKTLRFGTENQVTNDGQKNAIINGVPDWVYEEEFAFSKAFAWSPDSKFLAYIRFDETDVKEYSMKMFQGKSPSLKENASYPGEYTYKYPKAGEQNSLISVFSYDLKSKTKIEVDLGEETDIYIPRLKWTADANDLAVFRLNRRQNKIDVLFANPHTGDSRLFFTEKNDRYIGEDFLDDFIFLPDNDYFVVNSERDGFSHLYLYDRQGFEVRQLTQGEYDVTDFYGFDSKKKIFYYQAAKKSPMQREVYYVSLDKKKQGTLSPKEGTNKAVFSSGFQYFINEYTSLDTPKTFSLYDNKGSLVRVLEDNKALNEKLSEYTISSKSFFNFETSEGVSLNGWMIKPVNFDESKQYPVVMTQYSGPNSQQVLDRWSVSWYNYLAQEGFLVVCVDPRGTGARGQDFRKVTYMQLGKYESDDQVEAARYLTTLPYVDKNNISIWGWSYGGFMTLLSMEKGGDLFKAGVAIAPVANFKFYDTVYTERFMRTPLENPDGYEDNAPLNHPEGITGRLLLIHGSADDNVHLQNTMEMAEALVQANVQFDMAIYTNRNHGIYGGNTRMHLYQRVTDFLKNQLQ
ncbi:S9 family peptidase [Sunxiuqinia elliptica]|uniref:Dipeptidyl-peptidase-4 n=1 Tax=Sunxiuqinia elliptica TaxID=655355 RepID=A0A1I2INR1_9BACT|nr:S9 family peptidase [Sunxiuqinia elliptica]SFF42466.1 dipeptidyl-peptidase-4 [Sunxiuqinia elliptica]